jgi:hypothetical protein
MATLRISDLPDPLHQLMQLLARRHHSSLSQQELRKSPQQGFFRRARPTGASQTQEEPWTRELAIHTTPHHTTPHHTTC